MTLSNLLRRVSTAFVVLAVFAAPGGRVHAQDDGRGASLADARIGAWWPEAGALTRPSFGGRVAFFPWTGPVRSRIGLHLAGDYRSFGAVVSFDEALRSQVRVRRSGFALGGMVGADVWRRGGTALDVRIGIALTRVRESFAIDARNGFSQSASDGWETLCGFSGFRDRCRTDYDATGVVAVGWRQDVRADGDAFVGLDYTRSFGGRNLLVGTFGLFFH